MRNLNHTKQHVSACIVVNMSAQMFFNLKSWLQESYITGLESWMKTHMQRNAQRTNILIQYLTMNWIINKNNVFDLDYCSNKSKLLQEVSPKAMWELS